MLVLCKSNLIVILGLLLSELIKMDAYSSSSFATRSDLHEVHLILILEIPSLPCNAVFRE